MLTKLKRGKVYHAVAKENISTDGESGKSYSFVKGEKYMVRIYVLNISEIIVDKTKLTVNTSWLCNNFTFEEYKKPEEGGEQ